MFIKIYRPGILGFVTPSNQDFETDVPVIDSVFKLDMGDFYHCTVKKADCKLSKFRIVDFQR